MVLQLVMYIGCNNILYYDGGYRLCLYIGCNNMIIYNLFDSFVNFISVDKTIRIDYESSCLYVKK
jgi:hypothetical protein